MKNKTKLLCVVLMFTLLISILAACGGDTQPSATPSGTTPTAKPTPTDTTPSETTPGEDVGVKFPKSIQCGHWSSAQSIDCIPDHWHRCLYSAWHKTLDL